VDFLSLSGFLLAIFEDIFLFNFDYLRSLGVLRDRSLSVVVFYCFSRFCLNLGGFSLSFGDSMLFS